VSRRGAWAVVAAASLLGIGAAFSDPVHWLDWGLHDRFVSLATREPAPPDDIVIVAIDEPSLQQLAMPWPWPRRVHAALVRALASAGARTIVFDLVFDVPAPAAEDDGLLRETIQRAGNVVLAIGRLDRPSSTQWARPIPSLATAAGGLGLASVPLDPDGVVRRYAIMVDGQPSLAAAAEIAERPHLAAGDLIPFNGPPRAGIRTVSYYQAMEPGLLPRGFFRGKTVFVGRSQQVAPAGDRSADYFRTPVGSMAGVEIHASAFDALQRARFVREPFATTASMAVLLLPIAALSGWLVLRAGPMLSGVVLLLAATAWFVAGYALRAQDLARLPTVAPLITAITVLIVMTTYRYAISTRERRFGARRAQRRRAV
jgi:adenylate cyclase